MRRAIILLIALLIALLFSNVSMFTYAQEYTAQIGFSQQEHTVPLNNTFEVSIMLLQTDIPLGALQFEVHYPQDLLLFEGYNVTTSIPVLCEVNYLQPGKINIGMIVNVNMTDGALTSGELLRLKFTATGLGNGTMQLIPVDASDITTNITVTLKGDNATVIIENIENYTEFTLELRFGWNMVSLPVGNASFLSTSGVYQYAYWYDPEAKTYVTVPLQEMEPGKAYWVLAFSDTNLTVRGIPVTEVPVQLKTGWNMVGALVGEVSLSSLETDPENSIYEQQAYWYDPEQKKYIPSSTLEPGKGYWILAFRDCTLYLQLSPPPHPI